MKRNWRLPLAVLALLALGGCGVLLVMLLISKGPEDAAPVAGIIGVALGFPALVITLWSWARPEVAATADQVRQAQESLAGWIIESMAL